MPTQQKRGELSCGSSIDFGKALSHEVAELTPKSIYSIILPFAYACNKLCIAEDLVRRNRPDIN